MIKKIATGVAAGVMLLTSVIPALATTTDITIDNNGAGSTNKVKLIQNCTQNVTQTNTTTAGITLDVSGSTGGNKVTGNTGTGASIDTGDVTNTVSVTVTGGDNSAEVPTCCCGDQSTPSITISNNGVGSINKVKDTKTNITNTTQTGQTTAGVTGKVKGKTGKNKIRRNVGGTSSVKTGDVDNTVTVDVTGGSNTL